MTLIITDRMIRSTDLAHIARLGRPGLATRPAPPPVHTAPHTVVTCRTHIWLTGIRDAGQAAVIAPRRMACYAEAPGAGGGDAGQGTGQGFYRCDGAPGG